MIRAVLYQDEQGRITRYTANGHSDYAEEGYDIVCAGVSVLGCTCFNGLEAACGIEAILEDNRSGALSFRLPSPLNDQQMHDAQILMKTLRQGLQDLADQYPEDIKLSIKNGGN